MDEYNSEPPPLPDRPGRAVRIQSIDNLKAESKPNDYVDTTTIDTEVVSRSLCRSSSKQQNCVDVKVELANKQEQCENATNECREHLQTLRRNKTVRSSQSPALPPRTHKLPPLPPRTRSTSSANKIDSKNFKTLHTHRNEQPMRCNSSIDTQHHVGSVSRSIHNTLTSDRLQPSVLIISEQGHPLFPSLHSNRSKKPINQQPNSNMHLHGQKSTHPSDVTLSINRAGIISNSIICPECGQCRCSSCTGDRNLPEYWLCEGNCRCSAETVVDTLSCMCCVKSCVRDLSDNPEEYRNDICACNDTSKCCIRWSIMSALTLCLPCLLCYWPLRGGVALATKCYNSPCCRSRGCHCEKD